MDQCLQSYAIAYKFLSYLQGVVVVQVRACSKTTVFLHMYQLAQTQHEQLVIERFQADQCPVRAKDTMLDHSTRDWDAPT